MKYLVLSLFISSLCIHSVNADSCEEAFSYADASLINLKSHYFENSFDSLGNDFNSIRHSAQALRFNCGIQIITPDLMNARTSCLFLGSLLSNFLLTHITDKISYTLGQVLSLIPEIERSNCIDYWRVQAAQYSKINDDDDDQIWIGADEARDPFLPEPIPDIDNNNYTQNEEEGDNSEYLYEASQVEDSLSIYVPYNESSEEVIAVYVPVDKFTEEIVLEVFEEEDLIVYVPFNENEEGSLAIFVSFVEDLEEEVLKYEETIIEVFEYVPFSENEEDSFAIFVPFIEDLDEEASFTYEEEISIFIPFGEDQEEYLAVYFHFDPDNRD